MGKILEEDKKQAKNRRKPPMSCSSPCYKCPDRVVDPVYGKVCEKTCKRWKAYVKQRDATAAIIRDAKDARNYYYEVERELIDRRRKKYGN
jgi:hypothetical protein